MNKLIKNGILQVNNIYDIPFIYDPITDFSNRENYEMVPKYITVHNFGSSARAKNITEYVDNTDEVKSWHFTVGKNIIYQEMSILKNGWHAGDGEYGTGNRKSIGIEIEENEQAMKNAQNLILWLQNNYNKNLIIKRHYDWSKKQCPRWIMNYGWSKFMEEINSLNFKFNDVSKQHWAYDVINYAVDKGYMNGYPDNMFKPDEPLTRAMIAQILYNLDNK